VSFLLCIGGKGATLAAPSAVRRRICCRRHRLCLLFCCCSSRSRGSTSAALGTSYAAISHHLSKLLPLLGLLLLRQCCRL
jgi:hypothetical protein